MDSTPIERAIEFAGGSEAKLADAIGFTQPAINKAKHGRAGWRLALAIHHYTNGVVPASDIRPDLWMSPNDVPSRAPSDTTEPAQ